MCIIAAGAGISAGMAMMANVALATSALSAGVGAFGVIQQAQAASQAADYQAKVAENNQTIANQNSAYARQSGAITEQTARMKTAALIGNEKAGEASNGFDLNTGSALDLQAGTAMAGEQDASMIRSNTGREVYGYQSQSSNFGAQAGLDRMTAANASTAGAVGAFGSIIGGASALTGKYANFQKSGLLS